MGRWDDLRVNATVGAPVTRLVGVLDGLIHAAGLSIDWLCDWYDDRLMRKWS